MNYIDNDCEKGIEVKKPRYIVTKTIGLQGGYLPDNINYYPIFSGGKKAAIKLLKELIRDEINELIEYSELEKNDILVTKCDDNYTIISYDNYQTELQIYNQSEYEYWLGEITISDILSDW